MKETKWSGADAGGWGSFGDNTDFNVDTTKPVDAPKPAETATALKAAHDDEDNMAECTFVPIVQLEEVAVAAGTEDDKFMGSHDFKKLYRWGKDVTGDQGWKNRASNTNIEFYQQPNDGKVRVVCREDVTQKLRLNHFLPVSELANVLLRSEKFVQWSGCDSTINAEDDDGVDKMCMFNCKFLDAESAKKFHDMLLESVKNNEKLKNKN